ncbi:hypothetical protein [Actinomadura rugatobispora]|uniref:Uncharacterized protein n=1 Tax=Actinomadura rugatobispora TaxID=1994 RepID=A0ABW1AFN0_9ACTN|nr:hypothetical protein GCM10010200_021730 [Actinomadura rugatobispora]
MTTIERTGHSKNCERAEKPPCACECGGAEHGWQGALTIAAASSDRDLRELEQKADKAWDAVLKRAERPGTGRGKPGPQTADGQRAAIKGFVAEVVRWLRRDQNIYGATKQFGEPFRISRDKDPDDSRRRPTPEEHERFVEAHVIPRLRRELGDRRLDAFQEEARKAHFWCELLAQTAHALDEFQDRYMQAKQAVIAVLLSSDDGERPDGWASLLPEHVVIRRAVELVFEHLPRAATGGITADDAFRLIWPARVLAVLMCREPRRHPAVREYCVKPIVEYGAAEIREQVKDRLRQAFPLEWPAPSATDPGVPGERF